MIASTEVCVFSLNRASTCVGLKGRCDRTWSFGRCGRTAGAHGGMHGMESWGPAGVAWRMAWLPDGVLCGRWTDYLRPGTRVQEYLEPVVDLAQSSSGNPLVSQFFPSFSIFWPLVSARSLRFTYTCFRCRRAPPRRLSLLVPSTPACDFGHTHSSAPQKNMAQTRRDKQESRRDVDKNKRTFQVLRREK